MTNFLEGLGLDEGIHHVLLVYFGLLNASAIHPVVRSSCLTIDNVPSMC